MKNVDNLRIQNYKVIGLKWGNNSIKNRGWNWDEKKVNESKFIDLTKKEKNNFL